MSGKYSSEASTAKMTRTAMTKNRKYSTTHKRVTDWVSRTTVWRAPRPYKPRGCLRDRPPGSPRTPRRISRIVHSELDEASVHAVSMRAEQRDFLGEDMLFSPLSYRTEPLHFPFIPHIKDDCSGYLSSMYTWSFGDRDHFSFSRSRQESVLSSHFLYTFGQQNMIAGTLVGIYLLHKGQ